MGGSNLHPFLKLSFSKKWRDRGKVFSRGLEQQQLQPKRMKKESRRRYLLLSRLSAKLRKTLKNLTTERKATKVNRVSD
jgi:hypothetical protein